MKPITEHPEFRAKMDTHLESCPEATRLSIEIIMRGTALTAQSILQKEHEEEMEEFARWINKSAELQLFKERDGR